MPMSSTMEKFGVAGLIAGVASISYSVYQAIKIKRLENLIGVAVDKLSTKIDVEVPNALVREAIDLAVERDVARTVRIESMEVRCNVQNDLQKKVANSVSASFSNIKASVSEEVKKQVSNIDISELRRDIKEEAKAKVLQKFDGDLDAILGDFNQNLSNVSKIYNSIATNIAKK